MKIEYGEYAISPIMWNTFDSYYGDKSYREAEWVEYFVQKVREESAKELIALLEYDKYSYSEDFAYGVQAAIDKLNEPTELGDGWVWSHGEPMTEDEYREKHGKDF